MIKNPDFLIIPHQLVLDKNLQPLDRILYGVIYWLVKLKNERCVASNKTLKELCGCKTNRAISNSLENLEKNRYISRRYFDDKKKKRDELIPLIVFSRVGTNDDTVGTNDDTGVGTNDEQNNKSTIIIKDNKIATQGVAGKEIDEIIELFKEVNPSYKRLFANKTQRAAIKRLIEKYGEQKLRAMIGALSQVNSMPYMPVTITPYELEINIGKIKAKVEQEKGRKHNLGVIKT